MKQQFTGRYVVSLWYIIPTSTGSYSLMLHANTNFIVLGLTRPRIKATIYHTCGKHANHFTMLGGLFQFKVLFIVLYRYKGRVVQDNKI
jgi:hypothetical protein